MSYSPTRRTALVLVGEGTSVAYLTGAQHALEAAGVRFDLVVGKGVGAVVAAFGAIQAGAKLRQPKGLLAALERRPPWRLRAPYRAALYCLALAFGVFVSPGLVALVLVVALPLLAAARIAAPEFMASLYAGAPGRFATFVSQADPIYLRAMAFPIALLFALLVLRWVRPGLLHRSGSGGWGRRLLGEGFIELSPLTSVLERNLWEAVRGVSVEPRPSHRKEIGLHYRDLLASSLGQQGFRELIFYALDLDTGQEVPFVLLKERWLSCLTARSTILAEPIDLAGEGGHLLFDAVRASVTPPGLAPSVALRLPLGGRHGGEVHRFTSSLLAGQSAVADAVAAGAEQIIYVNGAAPNRGGETGSFEDLSFAAVRQALESDLRWAEQGASQRAVFIVRPDKPRLGLYEFSGRKLPGGERLELSALAAHGERDTLRLFIRPRVGEVTQTVPGSGDAARGAEEGSGGEDDSWGSGPREL
ncbi:MAG: hypothetical protein ACE5JI_06290 [Acidobacteriota bacterium]